MDHFTIRGLGGTDFRPVFSYVNRLLAEKKVYKVKRTALFYRRIWTLSIEKNRPMIPHLYF